MRPILLSVLCFFVLSVHAQNIVPNPNFALHNTCPYNYSQIGYATGWYSPTQGSADYFNVCSVQSETAIPKNDFGHQYSSSGSYAGALAFYKDNTVHEREYIATTIPALEPGAVYQVTVRLSLADTSFYACDGFGVFFYTNYQPDTTSAEYIPVTPQVDYTNFGILTERINWITLSKLFVPDSAYTHIAIGNFKNNLTTNYMATDTTTNFFIDMAYYYYDSVSVEKLHGASTSNISQSIACSLSPNPFTDHTTLSFNNPYRQPHQLSIYNIQGALVRQVDNITASEITIQRYELNNGIYYYQLRGPDNAVMRGKMIVQ